MSQLYIKLRELKQLCERTNHPGCNNKKLSKCDLKELGSGNFGIVKKCMNSNNNQYAVKKVKDGIDITKEKKEPEKINLINEAIIMIKSGEHDNIIKIMGVDILPLNNEIDISILLEIYNLGSLKSQLLNLKSKTQKINSSTLHKLVNDIASGMDYLSKKNIIHNDLASRNVLLSSNTYNFNNSTAKISDFGLSTKLNDIDSKLGYTIDNSNTQRPILWLAPEILYNNIFSEKSDVWSFGILLYEIEIFGEYPFYKNLDGIDFIITPDNIKTFKKMLVTDDLRHTSNGTLPKYIETIMKRCWNLKVEDRPTFKEILEKLKLDKKKNNSKKKKTNYKQKSLRN
jgi:serine/threonine protein kinase